MINDSNSKVFIVTELKKDYTENKLAQVGRITPTNTVICRKRRKCMISENIQTLRRINEMSQEQVAEALGVSRPRSERFSILKPVIN